MEGLKYSLDNATVTNVFPIGISKERYIIIVYPRNLGGLLSYEKSIKYCRV